MEAEQPEVPQEELEAHEANTDELLDSLLEDDADEAPEEVEAAPEADDEGEELEGSDAPEEDESPVTYTEDDYATAWSALRRDGWSGDDLKVMPREQLIAAGLRRSELQRDVDAAFTERAELRRKLGLDSSEASEGQVGTDDSAPAEFGDPATGTDLALDARPVVEALEDGDAEKATQLLQAQLAQIDKAVQARIASVTQGMTLRERAKSRLEGRYEGDIAPLLADAQKLGAAGLHSDKSGEERFDALLDSALKLSGKEVSRSTSTSRATRKRGARPPIQGERVAPKPRSEQERLDAKLSRILNGERDVSKLRAL